MRGGATSTLGTALALLLALPAVAAATPTRYSLQGGCFAITSASGQTLAGADQIRMQATDLGSYMLYRPDHRFLAAQPDGSLTAADAPSPAADFVVSGPSAGVFTIAPKSDANQKSTVRFAPAKGCAVF